MSVNKWSGGSHNDNTDYVCHLCKVPCHCPENLERHLLGNKHKAALRALGVVTSVPPEVQEETSQWGQTLGEQLDLCGSSEPSIGLEYVYEFRTRAGYPHYKCTLCNFKAGLKYMFIHVMGTNHRLDYLTKHHPDMVHLLDRTADQREKIKELAAEVEAKHGQQKIQYIKDIRRLKRKPDSEFAGPNKSRCVDLASDECYMESVPAPSTSSVGPAPSLPVQALQTPHAESKKTNRNVDDFGSNEELFEYLNQFEISCKDDAAFLLEVTHSFTRSLLQYRLKSTDTQQAAVAPQDSYPTRKNSTASSIGQHMYMEYPLKNMSGPHPSVPTTSTYQAGANASIMVTKPVSDAPISAYNVTPACLSPEGVVSAQESARAMQGGSSSYRGLGSTERLWDRHRFKSTARDGGRSFGVHFVDGM